MALGINTNIASINAQNQLNKSQSLNAQALERLSSGLRINSAKDDAAGLQIATSLDSQIRGQTVASRNANDAISMIQTAEGALDEVVNNLQRMRELAVQAANGSNGADQRAAIQEEMDDRAAEITRTLNSAEFNGIKLLSGAATDVDFQVGANTTADDTVTVGFADLATAGATSAVPQSQDVTDATTSQTAIDDIDTALDNVNAKRGEFGAAQNRMDSVLNTLAASVESAEASKSRILDADFASESAKLAKSNVLQQAGISVLAQANARPNQVLSLLQ
ncbi:flagellin FliC [Marinobacter lipolyticus]|uniref:flagellin N-terminal helical domain-containing protein n=1 Tax=Marinobacter lipolyticus TaxID=209639 RepID=UPI001BD08249|nr:flagellin [Marinobacter lipolyticus]MBS8240750.1 flagellin FliC [Marinobacter lipolyticus]